MAEERTGNFESPRKTALEWTTANTVLPVGVFGVETDSNPNKMKCGDGATGWNSLPYVGAESTVTVNDYNICKPLTIGFAGDSISALWGQNNCNSPIWWYRTTHRQSDIEYLFTSSVGGTSSSNLLAEQYGNPPQIDALEALSVKPDIMVVQTLQNDSILVDSDIVTFGTYVLDYCDRLLTAGVKYILLCGRPPKTSSDVPALVTKLNQKLARYANDNTGVYFVDVLSVWREIPTGADGLEQMPWKTGYSTDGTHQLPVAESVVVPLISDFLDSITKLREKSPYNCNPYDNDNYPYNSVLGTAGFFVGTAGNYNSVANANVAGLTSTAEDRWDLTDGDGVVITPSLSVDDDGYPQQVLTLSGTATALTYPSLVNTYTHLVTAGDFVVEAIIELEDVSGVQALTFRSDSFESPELFSDGMEFSGKTKFTLREKCTSTGNTDYAQRYNGLYFTIADGASPSGTVKISQVMVNRIDEQ